MLRMRGNRLTWLGHATFQVTTPSGKVVLFDPWLAGIPPAPTRSKNLRPRHHAASRTVTRITWPTPSRSASNSIRTSSPCHEIGVWLGIKGVGKVHGMNKGGTQTVGEIEVTMVHAFHSSGIQDDGKMIYAGDPAGYVVKFPGGLTVYHAGDTAVFGDMKIIGELYAPELALLPIGDLYTMGPREAALAIRLLNVKHVVPMHYGTFPALTGTPERLRELTQDIAGLEIHALKPGEFLA